MPRFVVEILASVSLSALCLGIGWGAIGVAPMELIFGLSALVMLALPFIGPAVIVIYGLIRQRFGVALGPVLLFAAIPAVSNLFITIDKENANSAIVELTRPTHADQGVLILDIPNETCDSICLQILAQSEYEVIIGDTSFKRAAPSDCLGLPFLGSTLDFIAHGYADVCASTRASKEADTALVIREISASRRQPYSELPSIFDGTVYELHERESGSDRLLGRWITGGVGARLPEFLLYPARIFGSRLVATVGTKFSRSDFYSAALGMNISAAAVPGANDPRLILDQLHRLPNSITERDRAAKLLEMVQEKAFILTTLETAANRAYAPNYNDVADAFAALNNLPQIETGFVTEVIQDIAKRDDPYLLGTILSSLMNLQDDLFANGLVIELATKPMSHEEEEMLTEPLMYAVVRVWKTEELLLEPIKGTFLRDVSLRPIQRWVIFRMIAANKGRNEAVKMVLSSTSPIFEQSVQATRIGGRFAFPPGNVDGWTFSECDVLVERSATLPTDALMAYLESVSDQCSVPWSKRNVFKGLYENLHPRIVQLESSGAGNSSDAQNIRAVLERFVTNRSSN